MNIATTRKQLRETLSRTGAGKGDIHFVPTMGALHEGHLSLVRAARDSTCKEVASDPEPLVVVSIFVNPTQFNDPSDLKNYPRTPERDLEMLRTAGVDVVFMPSVEEMYPEPDTRRFDFGELDRIMEGASRPGHFGGVAQVVSRLFEMVRPARAYFGEKDFQQIEVIREMVRQAGEGRAEWTGGEKPEWADVEIVPCPIVREADGLAMSSRNALLAPEYRAAAPDIYRALVKGGNVVADIESNGLLKVVYCERHWGRTFVAVQAGAVRLIDNFMPRRPIV